MKPAQLAATRLVMTQTENEQGTRERIDAAIRPAVDADLNALTATLARAFDDDPFINWMVMQDKRRARRIFDVMEISLRDLTFPFGEVYTTSSIDGGALWAPPGKWRLGILQQLMMLPRLAKVTSWKRFLTVSSGFSALERKHPEAPHYYLAVLGVEPQMQGRGLGGQLMRPVLDKCDSEHMPAYLESSKEKNVPLYERNGFKVTEKYQVPNGGPPMWLMWRDPR